MAKKKEFEHESLQDRDSLAQYLQTVTKGFQDGRLAVSSRGEDIALEPRGLIQFELRASQRPDRGRLTLRFTWKPTKEETTTVNDDLKLTPGKSSE